MVPHQQPIRADQVSRDAREDLVALLKKHRIPNVDDTIARWLSNYKREVQRIRNINEFTKRRARDRALLDRATVAVTKARIALDVLEAVGLSWAGTFPDPCILDKLDDMLTLELNARPWTSQASLEEEAARLMPIGMSQQDGERLVAAEQRMTRSLQSARAELWNLEQCFPVRLKQTVRREKYSKRSLVVLTQSVASSFVAAKVPFTATRNGLACRSVELAIEIATNKQFKGTPGADILETLRLVARAVRSNPETFFNQITQ